MVQGEAKIHHSLDQRIAHLYNYIYTIAGLPSHDNRHGAVEMDEHNPSHLRSHNLYLTDVSEAPRMPQTAGMPRGKIGFYPRMHESVQSTAKPKRSRLVLLEAKASKHCKRHVKLFFLVILL